MLYVSMYMYIYIHICIVCKSSALEDAKGDVGNTNALACVIHTQIYIYTDIYIYTKYIICVRASRECEKRHPEKATALACQMYH